MTEPRPVVHFLYQPGNGGLDRVAILLANGMAGRGIPTELWLTRATGYIAHLISPAVTVRVVPTPNAGGRGLQLFLQIPALARMIAKHRPRAIFSAGNQSNLSLAIARKLSGADTTKIIQKITNPILRPNMASLNKLFRTWRFGLTAGLGDMTLTLSEIDADIYSRIYPDSSDKFHAVPNPYVEPGMLDAGESRSARATGQPPRLLCVGRVAPQKGYETLVSSLALIADRAWSMTILGDGPLLEETKRQIETAGLAERITFKGFVSDTTRYFAESDILVLSSQWEGFPAVPIEAMATGCAVVATDCSEGLTHLMGQIQRNTVAVNDPEALARAIGQEIDEPGPIEPLRRCAAAYTVDNSITQHLRLMEELCDGV
ncbi:glycosyltransferase [Parasphingorhabdus sp.]|uniref:glycosyltransferase n=1 Tax=Parasphingorhabdus sp. TaxID=2709688 RepID=UPI003002E274